VYELIATWLIVGLILGFTIELGKLVFRICVVFLVRPKKTPLWPWTDYYGKE
jgi:uncharacterized membrane protein